MTQTNDAERLTVGMAQIAPVWLNRDQTLTKILAYAHDAAEGSLAVARNCPFGGF